MPLDVDALTITTQAVHADVSMILQAIHNIDATCRTEGMLANDDAARRAVTGSLEIINGAATHIASVTQ